MISLSTYSFSIFLGKILSLYVSVYANLIQLCPVLCDPKDCDLPGSSVHGILQARILEWVAVPSSRDLPNLVIEPASLTSSALVGGFFSTSATCEAPPLLFSTLKGLPVYFPPVYSERKHQTIPN